MGWIRGRAATKLLTETSQILPQTRNPTKCNFEPVENISSARESLADDRLHKPESEVLYPVQPSALLDESLPFIPAEVVRLKRRPGALCGKEPIPPEERKDYWIVVGDIVYDCTSFISCHPGGEQVIMSFVGEDCTWQFWRFHGKNEMEQYGKDLRIGRTKGIQNRFTEPLRFVGLAKLGDVDW